MFLLIVSVCSWMLSDGPWPNALFSIVQNNERVKRFSKGLNTYRCSRWPFAGLTDFREFNRLFIETHDKVWPGDIWTHPSNYTWNPISSHWVDWVGATKFQYTWNLISYHWNSFDDAFFSLQFMVFQNAFIFATHVRDYNIPIFHSIVHSKSK